MAAEFNPSTRVVNNLLLGIATLVNGVKNPQNKTSQYIIKAKLDRAMNPFLWAESLEKPLTEKETEKSLENTRGVLYEEISNIRKSKLSPTLKDALNKTLTVFSKEKASPAQRNILFDMLQQVTPAVARESIDDEPSNNREKPLKIPGILDFETLVNQEEPANENSFLTLPYDDVDVANFLTPPLKKSATPKSKSPSVQRVKREPIAIKKQAFIFFPEQIKLLALYAPGEDGIRMPPKLRASFGSALAKPVQNDEGVRILLSLEEFHLCNEILTSIDNYTFNSSLIEQELSQEEIEFLIASSKNVQTSRAVRELLGETFDLVEQNLAPHLGGKQKNAHFAIILTMSQSAACLQLLEERLVEHIFSKSEIDILIQKSQRPGTTRNAVLGEVFSKVQEELAKIKNPKENVSYEITLTRKQLNMSLEILSL